MKKSPVTGKTLVQAARKGDPGLIEFFFGNQRDLGHTEIRLIQIIKAHGLSAMLRLMRRPAASRVTNTIIVAAVMKMESSRDDYIVNENMQRILVIRSTASLSAFNFESCSLTQRVDNLSYCLGFIGGKQCDA